MLTPGSMPPEAESLVTRLETATAAMAALEGEVAALQHRLENMDVAAIHLGVRRVVEALLRHASRTEGLELPKNGTIQSLKDGLRSKTRDRLDRRFWTYLDFVQDAVNPNTHYQEDDVYQPPSEFRRVNPWDEILNVFRSLVCIAEEFVHHWPPPADLMPSTTGAETGSALPSSATADSADDEPLEAPTPRRTQLSPEQRAVLRDGTVADARENPEIRVWLADAAGLHQRGVTRRLNAAHGSRKLRNVFPSALEAAELGQPEETEASAGLDYQAIGNLTIKQARDLELSEDIATLTGLSIATVRRKLSGHGGAVVRRQFPWYFSDTIAELTVSAALRYQLTPVLASGLRVRPAAVVSKLLSAAGQTKLKTLFPELKGADS